MSIKMITKPQPRVLCWWIPVVFVTASLVSVQGCATLGDAPAFQDSVELAFLAQTVTSSLAAYDALEQRDQQQAQRIALFQLADALKFLRESGKRQRAQNALCPRMRSLERLLTQLAESGKPLSDQPPHVLAYVRGEIEEAVLAEPTLCRQPVS
jgi:hypothetical protein